MTDNIPQAAYKIIVWALVLPLIGTGIMCIIPFIGFVVVASLFVAPLKIMSFVYVAGFVPSAVTSTFFFAFALRGKHWMAAIATWPVAGVSSMCWWQIVLGSGGMYSPDFTYFIGGISVAASLPMTMLFRVKRTMAEPSEIRL